MYRFMGTRVQKDFQERIQEAMEEAGIDSLILTTPQNIFYATGFISAFLYGGIGGIGSDIAVVNRTGKVKLVVNQFCQGGAEEQTKGEVDIRPYPTWIFIEDYFDPNEKAKEVQPDMYKTFRMAVQAVTDYKKGGKVGIEGGSLPYDKYIFLQQELGADKLVSATEFMIGVRTIKFPWEIGVLRYSAQIVGKNDELHDDPYRNRHVRGGSDQAVVPVGL